MALTLEQEAAVIALISRTQKTISQLEAETALVGDKILPIENSSGTFAVTVDDVKDYVLKYQDRKSAIINGDFNIWQRGTSFSSVASATYTADRWEYAKTGAMVHDITRSTDVPTVAEAGRLFNYSLKVDCTTVDASIGSTDICYISQKIEGYNFLPLAQKSNTIGFWVKATKTGIYCVAVGNAVDRSLVSEITINAADTWEYKTITLAASPSAGTWDYTNGIGLKLFFVLAAGSSFHTTKDAWQTGVYVSTSSQVNACDSTSNNFYLCGVQLEAGSVATPFESRGFQQELALSQRYFEKSYDIGTAIGTATTTGANSLRASGATADGRIEFKVSKRSTPTITIYNPATGTAGQFRNESTSANVAVTAELASENGAMVRTTTVADTNRITWHYTANSEL